MDADGLSPRAATILRRAEETAQARAPAPPVEPVAPRAPDTAPSPSGLPSAGSPAPTFAPSAGSRSPAELVALVDQVVARTEEARNQLDALARTIERLSRRIEGQAATSPAAPAEPTVAPMPPPVDAPAAPSGVPAAAATAPPATVQALAAMSARPRPPRGAVRLAPADRPPPEAPRRTDTLGLEEPPERVNDSVRLLAVEMAVAGATRDEVAMRLRDAFGIADSRPVLDAVYGAGADARSRLPWS